MVFSLKKKCISSAWYGSHIIIIFWNVHVNGQSHCQVQGKCERVCLSCLLEIGRGNHFQLWESGFFIGSRCFDCYYTLAGRVLCNTVVWCMGAVASWPRWIHIWVPFQMHHDKRPLCPIQQPRGIANQLKISFSSIKSSNTIPLPPRVYIHTRVCM